MVRQGIAVKHVTGLLMGLALVASPAVFALNYQSGDVSISFDSDFSVGAGVRMESPDLKLIGRANTPNPSLKATCESPAGQGGPGCGKAYSTNGDDGNLSFDKHDLVSATSKLTSDLTLRWNEIGIFVRGSYFFDIVNSGKSFYDPLDFGGSHTATDAQRRAKIEAAQDHIGSDGDLLDAYLFGTFDVADRLISFRFGKQVLNWGESTFVLNGINSILALDANQARLPGATVEEIFRPQGMAFLAADITDSLGIELFYQYEWENTIIDASGSFYGTNDFAGIGGTAAETGFGRCGENSAPGGGGAPDGCAFAPGGSAIPRVADRPASDDGQFGVSLRWYIESLNDLDLGFYYSNYHSRLPIYSGNATTTPGVAGTGTYFAEYPEDIQLYGISFNTLMPGTDIAVQGEYSYKQDQPLQVEDVELFVAGLRVGLPSQVNSPTPTSSFAPGEYIQGFRRLDVSQLDVSFTKILGPSTLLGSAQTLILLEAAAVQVHSMPDNSELRFEAPGTYKPGNATVAGATGAPQEDPALYADDFSWGYKVGMRWDYNNVFSVLSVRPSILWQHDVNGTTPTPILNFIDERQQIRVGFEADYLSSISFGVVYTRAMEGGIANLITDRDALHVNYKYSF